MNDDMTNSSFIQAVSLSKTGATSLSPVKAARREKLLTAAEGLFASMGFRATTIEAIADRAAISKVTVYGYFRDKDAVFIAVAERLAARLQDAVLGQLAREAPISNRIAAALIAKQIIVFDLVRRSLHSRELFQAKDAHVSHVFETLDVNIIEKLAAAMIDAGTEPGKASQTAQLLFAAVDGIAAHAKDRNQLSEQINLIVEALTSRQF
jgi:AcrR family transcriptional regulator